MSEHLCTLSTGDKVYFYDKSIVIYFSGARKILSTSLYNGGYHDDYAAVYNYDAKQGAGMPCEMLADTYVEHMRLVSKRLALDPDKVSGMGTAASMENAVVETLSFKELTVTAIVTGGIETNGGRAGDPAGLLQAAAQAGEVRHHQHYAAVGLRYAGRSNGARSGDLYRGQDSRYSGAAGGQQILQRYCYRLRHGPDDYHRQQCERAVHEGAGKHSKLGELIGKTVKNAVKKALAKQSGLTPAKQHDVFRRLKRFDIKPGDMWQAYSAQDAAVVKTEYLLAAERLAKEDIMLVYTSLYVHLLDQHLWKLISAKEMQLAGQKLLQAIAEQYNVEAEIINEGTLASMLASWQQQFNKIIAQRLHQTEKES